MTPEREREIRGRLTEFARTCGVSMAELKQHFETVADQFRKAPTCFARDAAADETMEARRA